MLADDSRAPRRRVDESGGDGRVHVLPRRAGGRDHGRIGERHDPDGRAQRVGDFIRHDDEVVGARVLRDGGQPGQVVGGARAGDAGGGGQGDERLALVEEELLDVAP